MMTNYDSEEIELLKKQLWFIGLSFFTLIISMILTYNEILKHKKKEPLFSCETERQILVFNRILATTIVMVFLYLNIQEKQLKEYYGKDDINSANLQIFAGVLAAVTSLIALYVSITSPNESVAIENPEI